MFSSFRSLWTQVFPPPPLFTDKNLPSLLGKVYIVTGSNTGIGKEVAQVLFSKDAKVYAAARSEDKGQLIFLPLNLSDLTTIKTSAKIFLSKEDKLHVLFNNAGVMTPPTGSKTVQGYELQLGVNAIAPFLFTKLLTPTLLSTAKTEPPNTVRVVWVSSVTMETGAPRSVGIPLDKLDQLASTSPQYVNYAISKAGNYLYAVEFAKRYKDVTNMEPGTWIIPWGRFAPVRKDLVEATKTEEEGGNGTALKFWEWTEKQIKPYL
ncbi:retinol dehydrogenase [Paracoccidioides lutzii Pb01]|uniref:Retinol dehydrogenase n=1 Tax=Paracoccidioides lutzii (strain ATCC MYA-826 / Pb01) TaxID=502779 RepID=C1HAZ9_PARBA|nr:retinol dehydrogenase [Paracoccidioides lutzii Pb01]EEH37445.2 retinol dehydrogenase [Paracoccidioides lutzii Pb01]